MTTADNGIGKSPKGKVLHIIVPDGDKFQPLCDKRQTGYVWEHELTKKKASHITCEKCQEYKLFKDLFKPKEKTKNMPAKKVIPLKPKSAQKQKVSPKELQEKKDIGIPLAPQNHKSFKHKEEKKKEIKNPVKEKKPEELDDFYEQKTSNGKYQIFHRPSGQRLFDGIEEDHVIDCLIALNDLPIKWNSKQDPIPDGFVSSCKEAVISICGVLSSKQKTKGESKKEEKNKKRKRKLKRRKKEESKLETEKIHRKLKRRKSKKEIKTQKRTLKRRIKKPKKNLYGFRPGSPGFFVANHLKDKDGVILNDIIADITKIFKISSKKANSKFKGVIRKLARRKNVTILHLLKDIPENDIFKILEPRKLYNFSCECGWLHKKVSPGFRCMKCGRVFDLKISNYKE